MNELRFGILGCAQMARRLIPAMKAARGVLPVAIAARDFDRARQFAEEYGLEAENSYESLLARKDIHAIYVPLPEGLHPLWTMEAAKAGKHVLCEKTLAPSFAAVRKMVTTCKKNNVRLMEAFMFRYHHQHQKVRQLVAETLGPARLFNGHFGFWLENPTDYRLQASMGGGSLNDVGCYTLAASRLVLGMEPLSVKADLNIDTRYGVDTQGAALLEYPQGVYAQLGFGFQVSHLNRYEVWGTKGSLIAPQAYSADGDTVLEVKSDADGKEQTYQVKVTSPDQYVGMLEAFAGDILQPGAVPLPFEQEILAQARCMQAIRLSALENRRVLVAEIEDEA